LRLVLSALLDALAIYNGIVGIGMSCRDSICIRIHDVFFTQMVPNLVISYSCSSIWPTCLLLWISQAYSKQLRSGSTTELDSTTGNSFITSMRC
jgi:hypothetical protein